MSQKSTNTENLSIPETPCVSTETKEREYKTMKERWDAYKAPETLEECVKDFFAILDIKETSDAGRKFSPNYISSCRVWDTHRMNILIKKMKDLSNE